MNCLLPRRLLLATCMTATLAANAQNRLDADTELALAHAVERCVAANDPVAECLSAARRERGFALRRFAALLSQHHYGPPVVAVFEHANRQQPGERELLQGLIRARRNARDLQQLIPLQPSLQQPAQAGQKKIEEPIVGVTNPAAAPGEPLGQAPRACWQGRGADALAACLRLVALGQAGVHARLGDLYRSLGKLQPALNAYRLALSEAPNDQALQRRLRALASVLPGPESATAPTSAAPVAAPAPIRRALLIGNNRYRHLPRLYNAHRDVHSLDRLLTDRFGMRVNVLLDVTRAELIRTLVRLRKTLRPEDELLIYYAGHGQLDEATGRGYWLPVDAQPTDPAQWVATDDVSAALRALPARRVLIIADACYAGSFIAAPVIAAKSDTARGPAALLSRRVLTSGGLEPVLDEGIDGHSVFAGALLRVLGISGDGLTGHELFAALTADSQLAAAAQHPAFGTLPSAGHQGGDFSFQLAQPSVVERQSAIGEGEFRQ